MTLSYSPLSPNDAARSFYPKMHKHYPRISTEWLGQGYGIISKWDSIWHATVPLLCWSKRREKETQDREEKKVDQNPCRKKGRSLFPIFNWEKGPHSGKINWFFYPVLQKIRRSTCHTSFSSKFLAESNFGKNKIFDRAPWEKYCL